MKLLPLLALLLMAGCQTAPVNPTVNPTPDPVQNNTIKTNTPAELNAWPRRGWN